MSGEQGEPSPFTQHLIEKRIKRTTHEGEQETLERFAAGESIKPLIKKRGIYYGTK